MFVTLPTAFALLQLLLGGGAPIAMFAALKSDTKAQINANFELNHLII